MISPMESEECCDKGHSLRYPRWPGSMPVSGHSTLYIDGKAPQSPSFDSSRMLGWDSLGPDIHREVDSCTLGASYVSRPSKSNIPRKY